MNTDSYTVARCFAAGGTLAAILAWPMTERYGAVAGVSWLLVALLGLFGAWYDQRVVRRSKERRRAYTRSQRTGFLWAVTDHDDVMRWENHPEQPMKLRAVNPHSVIADLLIQEDHRRIRLAEENQG